MSIVASVFYTYTYLAKDQDLRNTPRGVRLVHDDGVQIDCSIFKTQGENRHAVLEAYKHIISKQDRKKR